MVWYIKASLPRPSRRLVRGARPSSVQCSYRRHWPSARQRHCRRNGPAFSRKLPRPACALCCGCQLYTVPQFAPSKSSRCRTWPRPVSQSRCFVLAGPSLAPGLDRTAPPIPPRSHAAYRLGSSWLDRTLPCPVSRSGRGRAGEDHGGVGCADMTAAANTVRKAFSCGPDRSTAPKAGVAFTRAAMWMLCPLVKR